MTDFYSNFAKTQRSNFKGIAPYILPTGERMNPAHPQDAEYYDIDQTAIIVRKVGAKKATRVFTSFGGTCGWELGDVWECRHDQTGGLLGDMEVVGIHQFKTGMQIGEVPNSNLAHAVFK